MDTYFIIAQLFAVMGTTVNLIAPQFKSERHVLLMLIPDGILWSIHYAMMGGLTGACVALVNLMRNTTCLFMPKRYHMIAVVMACSFMIVVGFLTWDQWYSALPVIASFFGATAVLYQKQFLLVRTCLIVSTSSWMAYEIAIGAYLAAFTSLFIITSGLIGIARKYAYNNQMAAVPAE